MSNKTVDLSALPVPDKKRRRASWFAPVKRFFVRNPEGGFVRWLQVDRYDDEGNQRTFCLGLASNDPRPLGLELCKATGRNACPEQRPFYCRNYGRLPVGVWIETVYAERVPLLFLPENAVNREEAA